MSLLGRFGSWLAKSQAFGSLLGRKFGTAEKLKQVAAVAQARVSAAMEEAAAQGRATPGAFGNSMPKFGRYHGYKLARRCARAYRKSRLTVLREVPTTDGKTAIARVPLYKLNVRGF